MPTEMSGGWEGQMRGGLGGAAADDLSSSMILGDQAAGAGLGQPASPSAIRCVAAPPVQHSMSFFSQDSVMQVPPCPPRPILSTSGLLSVPSR